MTPLQMCPEKILKYRICILKRDDLHVCTDMKQSLTRKAPKKQTTK